MIIINKLPLIRSVNLNNFFFQFSNINLYNYLKNLNETQALVTWVYLGLNSNAQPWGSHLSPHLSLHICKTETTLQRACCRD